MPTPCTDDLLRRRLEAHSVVRPLTDAIREKLTNAGIPASDHVPCQCWLRAMRGGYGRMWNGLRLEDTHRMSYRINIGPIPAGMDVLHHCDVTECWEPSHLWTGDQADNNRDRDAKGRNGGRKNLGRSREPSPLRGDKHPNAKLDPAKIREIARYLRSNPMSAPREFRLSSRRLNLAAIARHYGVSESLLYGIRDGRNWKWANIILPFPS